MYVLTHIVYAAVRFGIVVFGPFPFPVPLDPVQLKCMSIVLLEKQDSSLKFLIYSTSLEEFLIDLVNSCARTTSVWISENGYYIEIHY